MMASSEITGKRKRNQVSYVADDYFDTLDLEGVEGVEDEDVSMLSDDEDSFGPRKVRIAQALDARPCH